MIQIQCPQCHKLCGDWTPYRVAGKLILAVRCSCQHRWQINDVAMLLPPIGDCAPRAPVDFDVG